VTLHPILGYGDYFFPLWRMSILTADNPKFAQPEQSQPLVIITDSEIAHKKFLPAGWTGTGEMTYLDSYRRRFPVRYGLYRYSPLTKSSTNIQQFPQGVSALPTPLGIASTTENATHTFQAGKGTGQGEFDYPTGIAVDPNGNLLVADSGNGRIEKFSSNGKFVTSIGSRGKGEGQLREPNGIAVDRAGNMYVADAGNHRVEKLAPDGKFVAEWKGPGPGFYGPRRVAVGSDGSVYVVDQGHSRIAKFSPDGHPVTTWGIKGKGDGQFDDPTSVAVDPTTNKVYVADPINQRIQVSDSNGKFLTKWSVPEWGQPMGFEDLAIDSKTGRLYASSSHVTAVLIFDLNGTRLGSLTPKAPDKLEGPSALALFDRKLYVLDMTGNRISVIDL
jgi:DNA-binding beta-propeller fold protein YncE